MDICKIRSELLKQKGIVIWFTGLSAAGKTSIAKALEYSLLDEGKIVYRLDGDDIRGGINANLGFSEDDRNENIRRIYEIAALFKDASIVTLVSAISPYMEMRRRARERIGHREFVEVYVKADLQTLIKRDPKGLYRKALEGEINDFTGISAPYEEPVNPEITLDTDKVTIEEGASIVLNYIWKRILV